MSATKTCRFCNVRVKYGDLCHWHSYLETSYLKHPKAPSSQSQLEAGERVTVLSGENVSVHEAEKRDHRRKGVHFIEKIVPTTGGRAIDVTHGKDHSRRNPLGKLILHAPTEEEANVEFKGVRKDVPGPHSHSVEIAATKDIAPHEALKLPPLEKHTIPTPKVLNLPEVPDLPEEGVPVEEAAAEPEPVAEPVVEEKKEDYRTDVELARTLPRHYVSVKERSKEVAERLEEEFEPINTALNEVVKPTVSNQNYHKDHWCNPVKEWKGDFPLLMHLFIQKTENNTGVIGIDDEWPRLFVAKSTIPQAGWGLFAGQDIKAEERIDIYDGDLLTAKQLQDRYGEVAIGEDEDIQYVIDVAKKRWEDAREVGASFARYSNAIMSGDTTHTDSARFICEPLQFAGDTKRRQRAVLVATKDIKEGEEIFTAYSGGAENGDKDGLGYVETVDLKEGKRK